jgi:hypothetical protein
MNKMINDTNKWVSPRIENVSRSLGANQVQTFLGITFILSWRGILSGMILTWARAISEFGAVIILAYHPLIAPTLIYERFTTYGMKYAIPANVLLIFISTIIFIVLRLVSFGKKRNMIYIHDLNIQLGRFRIKKVDFRVKKGIFLVILGPTAAGKSIIIESIAGLVPIQSGKIIVNQKDVTYLKPEKRNISIC